MRYERHGTHRKNYGSNKNSCTRPMGNEQRTHKHSHRRVCTEYEKYPSPSGQKKTKDAVDNIGVAIRTMEVLMEISDAKVANKSTRDIAREMLDSDNEELTSNSEDDSDSDSDESCLTCESN